MVAWVLSSAATITASKSGVVYVHPGIGQSTDGIVGSVLWLYKNSVNSVNKSIQCQLAAIISIIRFMQ